MLDSIGSRPCIAGSSSLASLSSQAFEPDIRLAPRPPFVKLSARLLALLLSGLALAVILGTFALSATSGRRMAVLESRQRLADRATMLAEQAGRLLDAADLALTEAAEIANDRAWDEIAGAAADYRRLQRLEQRLEYVSAFWLTDENGRPRLTSRQFPAPTVNTSDREYFIRARNGATGPLLSTLLHSRVRNETNIVVAQRLSDAANHFRGIAQAVLDPHYFSDFYAQATAMDPAEIMLIRQDGAVLVRHPLLPDETALALRMPAVADMADYVSPADGVRRLAGRAEVKGYPLRILMGVDADTTLEDWRRQVRLQGIFAAIASLAVLALGHASVRRANQDRSSRLDLEERVRQRTAELEATVGSRDLLLAELNHRVKNNLQMVASLLRMQAARDEDPRVQELVDQSVRRIAALADVHTSLYRGQRIDRIEVADYLDELCRRLGESFRKDGRTEIGLACTAQPLWLTMDQAIPLGLIVNELVTNAFKHAFAGEHALVGGRGAIRVTLEPIAEGSWQLAVTDDGSGGAEPAGSGTGLGTRLVESLARQIGGSVEIDRQPSFCVRIKFPVEPASTEVGTSAVPQADL